MVLLLLEGGWKGVWSVERTGTQPWWVWGTRTGWQKQGQSLGVVRGPGPFVSSHLVRLGRRGSGLGSW